jgi:hypothetical protein
MLGVDQALTGEMRVQGSSRTAAILSPPMSALGQKQTSQDARAMSALPPKADIAGAMRNVRFVPKADIPHCEERCYSITSSAFSASNGAL